MAANRVGRRVNKVCGNQSPGRSPGSSLQRRQARVTVKYNRRELQRRLDTEKWIDCELDQLYQNQEQEMPDEVNIDELLDLKTDEERTHKLKEILCLCNSNTEAFVSELLVKLQGLQKQVDLHNDGIDLPQLHICPTRARPAGRGALP
ncbi:protein phosphatase 1 regulatory subunit 14A-like [Betta splendens]|uniref:Protein phosphatase 1 regulatory subunit 14A-like n=1 Tax=Betta splendens TaxID=158456 RepID=A0A6P7P807_BETSP|nr:protein phosphatase 1 regulatory subunit 14A-like [Betta splendens]XP_029026230.1 protein phosphatase 1 regulatory subunit 14A-like [Betta splendens]